MINVTYFINTYKQTILKNYEKNCQTRFEKSNSISNRLQPEEFLNTPFTLPGSKSPEFPLLVASSDYAIEYLVEKGARADVIQKYIQENNSRNLFESDH